MRHGRPDIDESSAMPSTAFPAWLDAYREAPLVADAPPEDSRAIAGKASVIVCSDLRRSIESAHRLMPERLPEIDSLFAEMSMPWGPVPLLRLSARAWATLFRLAWLAGYARNAEENRSQGRIRAERAADRLIQMAEQGGTVLFVGHGVFNRFVAAALRRKGWQGPADPGRKHWSYSKYQRRV